MSNYDLLNNVPPNVSLQRSTNVPETQLSPGFSPNLLQSQLSPNQRAPFSPQSNQVGYQTFNAAQNQTQQQQLAFQTASNTNSPRQPFPQGTVNINNFFFFSKINFSII